jgi:hypothetical protein
MTKPDTRQKLRPPFPAQSPASGIKAAPRPQGGAGRGGLEPCLTCRWRVWANGCHRCHCGPPQVRHPFDNLAAWPVVPETGGGCRLWEAAP